LVTPYQTEHVRAANRHSLYRALARSGEATRTELAADTGLSLPTVATLLGDLRAQGLVGDAGTEIGTGGRPARRVRFLADTAHVLAVDLSGRHAHACRIALDGHVRARIRGPRLAPDTADELFTWLEAQRHASADAPLRRVALAVPGVVDPSDGRVDHAPALGWHALPLAAQLETSLGLPVTLENDVNALALAELHYGVGAHQRHVLYVAIGSGLGAGVVIDGRLYRGANAAAGEIGSSLSCDADTTQTPHHGAPGPLEARVVGHAERCLGSDGMLDLTTATAREAFASLVGLLRPTLHNLACLLDPELLVVAWPADPDGHLAAALRDGWRGPYRLSIAAGSLGRDGAARGVGSLALTQLEHQICGTRPGSDREAPSPLGFGAAPISRDGRKAAPSDRSRHA